MVPFFYRCPILLGRTERPPSGLGTCTILGAANVCFMYAAPSILEEPVHESNGLKRASEVDLVVWTGGPLGTFAGDSLSRVTKLGQFVGSAEIGIIPNSLPRTPDNWLYVEFHADAGCELRPISQSNSNVALYELVFQPPPELDIACPAPHRRSLHWHTDDLYTQHPADSPIALLRTPGRRHCPSEWR